MKTTVGVIGFTLFFTVINIAAAAEFVIREYPDRIVIEYDGTSDARSAPTMTPRTRAPKPAHSIAPAREPRPTRTETQPSGTAELEQLVQMDEESRDRSKTVSESDGAGAP